MNTFKSTKKMKTIFNLKTAIVAIGFVLFAANAKAATIRMTIKEELASCIGVAPQSCYQVKYKNSKDWELFYGHIEGFDYTPGYRYVIDVIRTKRKNVPADASSYTYKLKRVIQKKQIGEKGADAWAFIMKHKWKLIQINGGAPLETSAYLTFQSDMKTMNGFGGCNRIFGGFELKENTIAFKGIASTLMACPDENTNKLEGTLVKMLTDNTFTYDIADQTLNFYQDNKLVLMFGKAPLD